MDGHPARGSWRYLRMAIVALEVVLHQAKAHLKAYLSNIVWLVPSVSEFSGGDREITGTRHPSYMDRGGITHISWEMRPWFT